MSEERARRLERLRSAYPSFVYEASTWRWETDDRLACAFRFRAGELVFEPTCELRFDGVGERASVPPAVMDNLVFHLGLAEIPSYWKATCSPRIEVRAGPLTAEQAAFWTWILTEGMGEFHYANQTPFTDPGFVTITADDQRAPVVFTGTLRGGHVVPIGGGKDSLVSLELLARRRDDLATLAVNPPPSTDEAIAIAGVGARVTVARKLDPRLLALNEAGFLNGHTPFGVVIAFVAALAALVLGRKHVTVSNEASSDYAPLVYRETTINHQFGKSWALEHALFRYLAAHVATELHYFSLLRPFNELSIAARFATLTAMHGAFRSCNRGRKTDTWCGRCPKCVSTFVILAPFVDRARLSRALGGDLLRDAACAPILASLLDEDGAARPFECVAAPDEIRAALALIGGDPLTPGTLDVLGRRHEPHLVPDDLYPVVSAALRPRVSHLLGRLGITVGVLGLGREGLSTARSLLAEHRSLHLVAIDDDEAAEGRLRAALSPDVGDRVRFVCSRQPDVSPPALAVLFKSPGIPPEHRVVGATTKRSTLLSSNTELFFERRVGRVIGVTGTKGKSTTTSLIAHVLAAAGKDARLVGNIGTPCLDGLAGATDDTVFCVELSSFQLERLSSSPDIAVVLGVFGDHLDRYGEMASYVAAKAAITRYQTKEGVVLFNADCPRATALAALSPGRQVGFDRARPEILGDGPAPLLGSFNHYNLWPAIHVGRLLGLDDDTVSSALRSFRPLSGRLETVSDRDGVRFVCDIRSTAPEVTVAALSAFAEGGDGVDFLFLGGVDRQQDYRTLLPALAASSVRHIVLFPPTGARIRALLEASDLRARFTLVEPRSMEEAVRYVYQRAPDGRCVCLMSTGAPSNGGLFAGPEDKVQQFTYWATHVGREPRTA